MHNAQGMAWKALEKARSINVEQCIVDSATILARIYLDWGDLLNADVYLKEAMEVAKRTFNRTGMATAQRLYGTYFQRKQNIEEARQALEFAINIFERMGLAYELEDAQRALANLETSEVPGEAALDS